MKYKTLKKSSDEYDALVQKVVSSHPPDLPGRLALQIIAVTGDFEPTQSIADARWLSVKNNYGYSLVMIDGVGDIITIIPED